MESKAGPSTNVEHCSNNSLDDAVGKLLQGMCVFSIDKFKGSLD